MSFKTPKKLKTLTGVDRISDLPDPIIVHILSFLPTIEEAIRTGILSKRWRYLWTSIPVLDFSTVKDCSFSEFTLLIDKTLDQCSHSKPKKLKFDFRFYFESNFESNFESELNRYIRYAVDSNVEELDIFFVGDGQVVCEFPQYAFLNNSLTSLALSNCIFVPNGLISWKLLKTLALSFSELSDDFIRVMISGSPVLEVLKLSCCWGFDRLDITSQSIKKLVLDGHFDPLKPHDQCYLEIHAPNILSLDIDGYLGLRKLLLFNMPSLVEARLAIYWDLDYYYEFDEDADENMVKGLLQSLNHVNELAIGSWCLKIISRLELKGWHSPLSRRKCLKIGKCICRSDFPGLSNLLHGSPDLHTLHVTIDPSWYSWYRQPPCDSCTGGNYLCQTRRFRCLRRHLKNVRIDYFIEWDCASELVRFLLDNARVLERMDITCRSNADKESGSVTERLMDFASKLLSFPRASRNAVVLFPGSGSSHVG